jgi:hypothetical protein
MVYGIFVLAERRAVAKTVPRKIGIMYSDEDKEDATESAGNTMWYH